MMDSRLFGALRPRCTTRPARRGLLAAVTGSLAGLGLVASTLATSTLAAEPAPVEVERVTLVSSTTDVTPDTYQKRVQRLVNLRRAGNDLPRLRIAGCAQTVAEDWSRYLAANDEFYHQSMVDVLNRCDATYAGETLGRGSMTPRKLVRLWMESPGHRAVLLSPKARRIGVGATADRSGRWVVAVNFLRF